MPAGSRVVYDGDKLKPGVAAAGVQLCPMPMKQLCGANKLAANTAALGAVLQMLGIESEPLEAAIAGEGLLPARCQRAHTVRTASTSLGHGRKNSRFTPFGHTATTVSGCGTHKILISGLILIWPLTNNLTHT